MAPRPTSPFLPRLWYWMALILAAAALAPAGEPAPRPLSEQDFDAWRSITTPTLSRDGNWLAYAYMPEEGDGEVVIRQLATAKEWRAPAGATPAPPFPLPTSLNEKRYQAPVVGLSFTSDSRFLVATTFPTKAAAAAARIAGRKPLPRGLLITNLASGKTEPIAAVTSVQVPARGGPWIAYLLEPAPPTAPAKSNDGPGAKPAPAGSTLVLRNLATGQTDTLADVTDYSLATDGRTLLFAQAGPLESRHGVYAVTPGDPAPPKALLHGAGRYAKLAWDRAQTQAAFLSDRDEAGRPAPRYRVYLWTRGSKSATAVVSADTPDLAPGMTVSDEAAPAFSLDSRKLYVGVAPAPVAPLHAANLDPEDKVTANLWSWNDDLVQSRQEVRAAHDRALTYRGEFDLASGRYVQLADTTLEEVSVSDDGNHAIGYDFRPYYRLRDYDGTYADVYTIDPATGARRLVIRKLRGNSGDEGTPSLDLSPDGRWAVYFADRQWHALNVATGATRDLTTSLPVAFCNEDHDQPDPAPAYGWAGWARDSQSCLLYDRYDIWQVWPDGRPARNLTQGYGRAHRLILRWQDLAAHEVDEPARGVDLSQPLVFRGESEETRATGFYREAGPGDPAPLRLWWGDKEFRVAGRALAADTLLLTASRFDEFPDVWLTDTTFATPRRVTDGGAQLKPFNWGSAELVNYRNADGVPLQALLYKPAGFDPRKKYPLIVYSYERLSQILHRFIPPTPGSNISFPFYASNGYLILLPDIVYTTGHPGQSALKCVNAALDAVIARGFVDEKALGIQGSSWGGYTAAYLITQTHRFAAAEAGAVVGNMTSAYGGIRWTSGQPRLFQYEQTQSRIGRPLADAPELYLENSPVFHVQQVTTPLLLLHNDRDGAVPWYQSIELFLALRRYDKPVWWLNYRDEGHGLIRRANQKDFSRRLWQYFDHYLRGAPAPDWLRHGVPWLDRDTEKIRFDAPPANAAGTP
ncbi:MAG: S9 family peptidase [Opitutales bacterium]